MSLLLALLYVAPEPEPEPTKRGSGSAQQRKPQRARFEVDRFSDFPIKPITITRSDDDEYLLIAMLHGG